MTTVDASVGTQTANSYVVVADADAYFEASFGRSSWASVDVADKATLVVNASRALDTYITWEGQKTSQDQSMEWPRTGAYDKIGIAYDNDVIPMPVKFATYELAYYLFGNGGLNFSEQSVDRVKVGPIDVEFTKKSVDSGIPKFIEQLIAHIGSSDVVGNNSVMVARLVRA